MPEPVSTPMAGNSSAEEVSPPIAGQGDGPGLPDVHSQVPASTHPSRTTSRASRSARTAAALARDEAILTAAETVLAREGWAALQFGRVASAAGVSVQALRTRYLDRLGLAGALWRARYFPALDDALASLADSVTPERTTTSSAMLAKALITFAYPSEQLRGAAELMVVSCYEPQIRSALDQTLLRRLTHWLPSTSSWMHSANAARRGYVFAIAFGLTLMSYRLGEHSVDLTTEAENLANALNHKAPRLPLPEDRADHLDEEAAFGTGEPTWDALLQATLDHVGAFGFDRATVTAIAHAANRTEGFIFSRYPTKRALFLDATARMTGPSIQANAHFQDALIARYTHGIAEAVMMREFMRPGRELKRTVFLEQSRLASHEKDVRDIMTGRTAPTVAQHRETMNLNESGIHLAMALGVGAAMLAALSPMAWELPFDAVTVPLLDN